MVCSPAADEKAHCRGVLAFYLLAAIKLHAATFKDFWGMRADFSACVLEVNGVCVLMWRCSEMLSACVLMGKGVISAHPSLDSM